jgi:hypothetical protein
MASARDLRSPVETAAAIVVALVALLALTMTADVVDLKETLMRPPRLPLM